MFIGPAKTNGQFISPHLEFFTGEPEQGQADHAAGGVHDDIGDEGGAAGDVDLVEFIGGGVEEEDRQGEAGFIPAPGASVVFLGLADGAPGEKNKEGVFGQVTAFAEEMMQVADVLLGHMREEPADEGFKDPGGVVRGVGVAGGGEDDAHPHKQRQPVDDEFLSLDRHAAG